MGVEREKQKAARWGSLENLLYWYKGPSVSAVETQTSVRYRQVQALLLSCLTLCDPTDCNPPGSSVHGILQARIGSGLPSPPPGDFLIAGIKTVSPALQVDSLPRASPGKSRKMEWERVNFSKHTPST